MNDYEIITDNIMKDFNVGNPTKENIDFAFN